MSNKLWLSLILFILTLSGMAAAQNMTEKDVDISLILPEEINISQEYAELLLVKNNNDTPGFNDNLEMTIHYNLSFKNITILNFSAEKNINYYTKSGLGSIQVLAEGSYVLCASIEAVNYIDPAPENDNFCRDINAIGPHPMENLSMNKTVNQINDTNVTISKENTSACQYSLYIHTAEQVYEKGDTIKFKIYLNNDSNSSFPLEVEYWVEDLFGKTTKNSVTTKSKSEKSYTPRFSESEKSYWIRAKNHNCSLDAHRLVVLKGEKEERDTEFQIAAPETALFGEILFVEINGYKGNEDKKVISAWVEGEKRITEITKTYINIKHSQFSQKIPLVFKHVRPEDKEYRIIVDGLGVRKELEIEIEYEEEPVENKSESHIKSLYTLKKNFDEAINVYATIENPLNYYIEFSTSAENKTLIANKSINTILTITKPDETIYARLVEIIDDRNLELNLTLKEKTIAEATVVQQSKPEEKTEMAAVIEKKTSPPSIKENPPLIKTSQVIFFSAAIVASAVLFRKDIRGLLRKTKLFK